MKALNEYPRRLLINRTAIQVQLGIRPEFTVELVSARTIKHKTMQVRPDYQDYIIAPSGWRIYRMWHGHSASGEELDLFA